MRLAIVVAVLSVPVVVAIVIGEPADVFPTLYGMTLGLLAVFVLRTTYMLRELGERVARLEREAANRQSDEVVPV